MADPIAGSESAAQEGEAVEFVEVIFAKSIGEAKLHCGMLEAYSIPSRVEKVREEVCQRGVAVLIPADRLVEASEILAVQTSADEEEDVFGEDSEDEDERFEVCDDDDLDCDDDEEDEGFDEFDVLCEDPDPI